MHARRATVVRFAIYVALYVLAAEFALVFMSSPNDVTLIWPSSGIAFAVLLFHGLRWWPLIPVAVAAVHLLVAPAAPDFVAFSIASNTIAATASTWMMLRLAGPGVLSLRVSSGLLLLLGALNFAVLSGVIGAAGMLWTGMIEAPAYWVAFGKWAAGDAFGIIVIAPFALMLLRAIDRGRLSDTPPAGSGLGEKWIWLGTSGLGVWLIVQASIASPAYALGMSFLPLALLLWSALRFEPIVTAGATMLMALTVVTLIGLNVGGFSAPSDLLETFVLLALLCVMAVVPQLVSVANYRVRAAATEMLRRARSDSLSGLPNRSAFEEAIGAALQQRPDIAQGGALGYIDLDQFKLVNDIASHAVGDEAIRQIASLLRARLPADVFLARLGADEFGLLWPRQSIQQAQADAQALRRAILEFRLPQDNRVFSFTASIGVVPIPSRQADMAQLLAQADSACYTAKELGGNRVQVLTQDHAAMIERSAAMDWVVRLNQALEEDRFELHGQYIRSFDSAEPEAIEVLLRLPSEDGEALLPGRFIPAAERFQMAPRIDRHVVEHSLRWLEGEGSGRRLNINLSAATLADDDFRQYLQLRLRGSSVSPTQICFEITETSAVRDLDHARRFIAQFKALGVRFALDDFGTGFCSFSYLRDLDVDVFKIDGSFVADVDRNPLSLAIVRAIVEIARVLGKRTVAEAVESVAIGRRMQELGVDAVQGYAYHRPQALHVIASRAVRSAVN